MENRTVSDDSFTFSSKTHRSSLSLPHPKTFQTEHINMLKLNEILNQYFPSEQHLIIIDSDLHLLHHFLQETSISTLLPTLLYITTPGHYYSNDLTNHLSSSNKAFLIKQILIALAYTFNQFNVSINQMELINEKKTILIKQHEEEKRLNSIKKNKLSLKDNKIKQEEDQMKLFDSLSKYDILLKNIEMNIPRILEEFNIIFALGRKMYVSRMIGEKDIIFLFKIGFVYSIVNYKTCRHLKHFDLFYYVLEQLITLTKDSLINRDNSISEEEFNTVISSSLNYFTEIIKDNYALVNLLKSNIKSLQILLRLFQYKHLHSSIKSTIINFLTFIYEGSYNIQFLHVFISTMKASLFHYNQLNPTNEDIRLLSSQLLFIREMLQVEKTIRSNDPYQCSQSFISNSHPSNGVSMILPNAQNINKAFAMILSFQAKELCSDVEYPLITFNCIESQTVFLRLIIKKGEIIFESKTKFVGAYDFKVDKTYMIVIDWKKEGIMGNRISFNLSINKEEVKGKKNEIELTIKERFEVTIGNDPEDNMKNFIGRINPVIMFNKGLDNEQLIFFYDLYGDYVNALNLCTGIDLKSYEEFDILSTNNKTTIKQQQGQLQQQKNQINLIDFIRNNCLLVISPISIQGQINKRNKMSFPEVVYDIRKDNKDKEMMYNFNMFPLINNCGMYPNKYLHISREFIRHDGFELISLHLEFYYNLLFQKINQGVQIEIMNGISQAIRIIHFYLENHMTNFELLKEQYSTFFFSLTKVITLMTDYNQYFSNELSNELILLFKCLLTISTKEDNQVYYEINEYTSNMFILLLNTKFYDLTDYPLLTKLFYNLTLYIEDIPGTDNIIRNQTLDLLMKFNVILSKQHLEMTSEQNNSNDQLKKSNQKKMNYAYEALLGAFITKCTIAFLAKILNHIFDSPTMMQKYKLLKIYYFYRNKNLKEVNEKKAIDLPKKYKDYFDAQTISLEATTNHLNEDNNDIPIPIEDKYQERLKAILLQLILEIRDKEKDRDKCPLYEDIKRIKSNIVSSSTSLINQKSNSSFNSLTNKSTNSSDGKLPYNDQCPLIRLKNIVFNGQISFIVIKSIFLFNYESWDPQAKVCFMNESKTGLLKDILTLYDSYNLCLPSFNKQRKNHFLFFIQLLYRIDNQDHTTIAKTILLFCNYIHQVFKAYTKSNVFLRDPDPIKCQYNHLFESKSIMCSFFTICFESIETSEYAYITLTEIISHLVWEHYNPFIFKFTYSHMKNNTGEVFFVMKHMGVAFLEQIALDDNIYLPPDKSINIIRYFILAHKLICTSSNSIIPRMTKEVIEKDCLSDILISLIKTFKYKSLYYYSNILIVISKKHRINRTIYQMLNDLLMSIIEITEWDKDIGLINDMIINHNQSYFYQIDMRKKKVINKIKREIFDDEFFIKSEAELKGRIPVKDQDTKLAVIEYYINFTRFLFRNQMFSFDHRRSLLQKEIIEITTTLLLSSSNNNNNNNNSNDKEDDYLYNNVLNSIKFYKDNKKSKSGNPLKVEDLFESIDKIINQAVENEKMETITEITAITEKSYGSKGLERKDSFSACKCIDNNPTKKNLTSAFENITNNNNNETQSTIAASSFTDMHLNNPILCLKRDLLLKHFSFSFSDVYFSNRNFQELKRKFNNKYPREDISNAYYNQTDYQTLQFPSKIKNYSPTSTFYPKIYLRQDLTLFNKSNAFFNSLYPSLDRKDFRYKLFKVHHGLLNRKNMNLFSNESNDAINPQMLFPCERISHDTTCFGSLYITKHYILYQSDKDINPLKEYETNHHYLFTSHLYDIEQKTKQIIIPLNKIDELFSRRFLYYYQAIEVFMTNGKSYFFNLFSINKQLAFIKAVEGFTCGIGFTQENSITIIRNPKEEFNSVKNYKEKWRNGQLLTYDYLLQVNKYSGRSYNDLNQYPIMPWVILPLRDNPIKRDFQYPISVQNELERKRAQDRYNNPINPKYACHFGIHFSNSAFVNTYLVRMLPFTTNQIKFQTGKFDYPDRQFASFEGMINSLTKHLDNRELIPELFVMPEFAYNLNYVEFGRRNGDGMLVNNLHLTSHIFPSPLSLIIRLKLTMNSKSKEIINLWIDNIFGVNQTKSSKGFFLYPKETYEHNVIPKFDIYQKEIELNYEKILGKVRRKISTIMPIGQFPIQLFDTSHPVCLIEKEKEKNKLQFQGQPRDNRIGNLFQGQTKDNCMSILSKASSLSSSFNFIKNLTDKHVVLLSKSRTSNLLYFLTSQNGKKSISIIDFDLNIKSHYALDRMALNPKINHNPIYHPKYSIIELYQCDMFIVCRFYDNTIKVIGIKSKLKYSVQTESFVTCIKLIDSSSIFSGHQNGKLIQWNFSYDNNNNQFDALIQHRSIIAHKGCITAIDLNNRNEIVITAGGEDHQVYLRKMYDYELLSVIDLGKNLIAVDIQLVELYDMFYLKVFNWNDEKYYLALYSMNGLCFEMTKPCSWLEFSITEKNRIVYVDSTNIVKVYDKDLKEDIIKKAIDVNKGGLGIVNGMYYGEDIDSLVIVYNDGDFRRMSFHSIK